MIIQFYKEFLLCFLKQEYVFKTPLNQINPKNGEYQLFDSQMYLGIKVMNSINDPSIKDKHLRREFFKW